MMTSLSTEPPSLLSVPSTAQRRSYRCYNCNYSFHIIPTAATTTSSSSFRCPGCHHRHLIPYHTISLPLPPLAPSFAPPRISDYVPASISFVYQSSDEDEDQDEDEDEYEDADEDEGDYDSDNSLLSLTTPDFHAPTPASKSIVDSLPVKKFAPNSAAPSLQSCSICMEDFVVDSGSSVTVNELPCEHYFHRDCIVEWLQRSNSCPLCRYKLPVDPDPEEPIDDPSSNQRDVEYDADLVTRAREFYREENLNSEANSGGSDVGGLSVNVGEMSNWNFDAMRDEDGDTLMIDA